MNNHIMLDLETLGTSRNSVIVSIGAVRFDPNDTSVGVRYFTAQFDADGMALQQRMGMTIDAATVAWWMRQGAAARQLFTNPTSVEDPVDALSKFAEFYNEVPDTRLWACGTDLDNSLLSDMYKAFSLPVPWRYSVSRDYRTMREIPGAPKLLDRHGVEHDALDDAITQMKHLQEIYTWQRSLLSASQAAQEQARILPHVSSQRGAAGISTPSQTR